MFKFLSYFFNEYKNYANEHASYDEDGNYIDPKVGRLSTNELMISAEKARILHSKSAEDAVIKLRKKVFYQIHSAIQNGKNSVRLELYMAKPDTLAYLESLGYTIETITPSDPHGMGAPLMLDNDGEITRDNGPYRYYKISWGTGTTATEAPVATVTSVNVRAGTVTVS